MKNKYCKKGVVSYKRMQKLKISHIVRTAILKCSEKNLFLNCLNCKGNMCGRDHPYSGVHLAAWNVTGEKALQKYFPVTYLKSLATSILPVGQLRAAAR